MLYEVITTFPPNVNEVRYRDGEVTLKIPLTKSVRNNFV